MEYFTWNTSTLSHLDPRTNQCELENQKIIHLQSIANQLPDAFTDTKNVTKSYIPVANTPARIDVHVSQSMGIVAIESKARQKRGKPISAKDKISRKMKGQEQTVCTLEKTINGSLGEIIPINESTLEEARITK